MTANDIIDLAHHEDGVVVVTLDDGSQQVNTMNGAFTAALEQTVEHLESERDEIAGVIITSGKDTFVAGGDLNELFAMTPDDKAAASLFVNRIKSLMRRIETLGRPVVAALNGTALGGGLELSLACHRRVAVDRPDARFGTPEVTLGLLPGGGGIVRLTRMLGVKTALEELLLDGRPVSARRAHELGIVDELVADRTELLVAAKAWIAQEPDAVQPWESPGYEIPGGTPATPTFAQELPALPASLRKKTNGAHYDAPHHIMAAAVESTQVDVDTALKIETRYFVDLACNSAQAKNMMQAFFFDMQHANGGGSRPTGHPRTKTSRIAVLGAGMMGAGIAHACATSGMEVVLTDTTMERARAGKAYSEKLLSKLVDRGRTTQAEADAVLSRITPTADLADADGCEAVIEAVFESMELKQEIFEAVRERLADDPLIASNTSTLPITELARSVDVPGNFVGLHFFSPVDRMPLVEVVRGEQTTDATLARALDLVGQIKKTPIVVNDGRGFFTSRVILARNTEAFAMVAEGIHPLSVERAALQAGYPVGALQLTDEVGLQLQREVEQEAVAAATAAGEERMSHPGFAVLDRMVEEFGRTGKAAGAGFYDYEDGRRTRLWPGLAEAFGPPRDDVDIDDLKDRLLFAEALETVHCFAEGVVSRAADANVGSLLGIGYPRWTGGTAQFVDGYPGGCTGFAARAKELADRYGDRFSPPPFLIELAETGRPLRRD